MDKDVYIGIVVSKTELVVAVRPSSESFTLAYDRAGLKQLVGRLGELKPKLVVVEADRRIATTGGGGAVDRRDCGGSRQSELGAELRAGVADYYEDRLASMPRLLALFAQREQPVPRPPLDAETQALQELATRRDQLLEMAWRSSSDLSAPARRCVKSCASISPTWRAASSRSTMTSTRPCSARRPGAARARCCAAFRGWARCSAPRCCPSCRN